MPEPTLNPGWNFQTTYQNLHPMMFSQVKPQPAESPSLVLFNDGLAAELGLVFSELSSTEKADIFSGSVLPEQASPIAQAYAGHQFGQFTMLGDGRAVLFGEHKTPGGQLFDIQFKGSGRTPYSRGGDGRATLYSMLREYLISEAMHGLQIPSSRSLAVAETGEQVYRTRMHKGAVLTRVSSSHIRVGTFEFARRFLPAEALEQLLDYTIGRHFPELTESSQKALDLLRSAMTLQIGLITKWMSVGFIHGVMNTDNMALSGETIDYGPCAFMNRFNPKTTFSSIDAGRRYAWGNQPGIAKWNLGVLAGALLPLIDADLEKAKDSAREILESFDEQFQQSWYSRMAAKLGIAEVKGDGDRGLTDDFFKLMQQQESDFTNSFLYLENSAEWLERVPSGDGFTALIQKIRERQLQNPGGEAQARQLMQSHNPFIIPRNHQVEKALTEAAFKDDYRFFHELLSELKQPYRRPEASEAGLRRNLTAPPEDGDGDYRTFCGT